MAKGKGSSSKKGIRNDGRPNGKAWKQGKHPEVREAEQKARRLKRQAQKLEN